MGITETRPSRIKHQAFHLITLMEKLKSFGLNKGLRRFMESCRYPLALTIVVVMPVLSSSSGMYIWANSQLTINLDEAVVLAAERDFDDAIRLAERLRKLGCQGPEVIDDSASVLPARPLILLGNATTNRVIRRLYFEAYDFTDSTFPGPGNAAVRTIPDPLEIGADVIVVGASDAVGLHRAVTLLLDKVDRMGCNLDYFNIVAEPPPITSLYQPYLGSDFEWNFHDDSGWNYMRTIARLGAAYLHTGNEAFLPLFRDHFRIFGKSWVESPVSHDLVVGTQPVDLHGFIHWLVMAWDLIAPHPFFDRDREEINRELLRMLQSKEGPARLVKVGQSYSVRGNHDTRSGLDAYFGGRWAWRRQGLVQGQEWMQIAEEVFAPQLKSAKPLEDSWGHQWTSTLLNTAVFALASGKREYFESQHLRMAAERALIAHSHTESGPALYLALVAAGKDDPRFLSLTQATKGSVANSALLAGYSDEFLRGFGFFNKGAFHEGAVGLVIAPLDPLWYRSVDHAVGYRHSDGSTGPEPGRAAAYLRTVTLEESFDKIGMREGYGREDFYLLLDGISGGDHAYQDANCIKRFVEGGVDWLGTGIGPASAVTVRQENGVYTAIDGSGPGYIHRFARRLHASESNEFLSAGSALSGLGDVDTERHVLRYKGKWTFVIDRIVPRKAGELLVERNWWIIGEMKKREGRSVSEQRGDNESLFLHVVGIGIDEVLMGDEMVHQADWWQPVGGGRNRIDRIRRTVRSQDVLEMAALLYTDDESEVERYAIKRVNAGWLVKGNDHDVLIGLGDGNAGGHMWDAPMWIMRNDSVQLMGDEVRSFRLLPNQAEEFLNAPAAKSEQTLFPVVSPHISAVDWKKAKLAGPVTAVAPAGEGWAAGDAEGNVVLADSDGNLIFKKRFSHAISALHYYPGGDRIGRGLCVGGVDGSLSFVDQYGALRWTMTMPWKPMIWTYYTEKASRAREIDSADFTGNGIPEILVANADRHVWIIDATDGEVIRRFPVDYGVFTALNVTKFGGNPLILGGISAPSFNARIRAFTADGTLEATFARGDLLLSSCLGQVRDLQLADLSGDGEVELVALIDTTVRQLIVYRKDGGVFWDADLAGGPATLAISQEGVFSVTSSGYLIAFDHAGESKWFVFIGVPARILRVGSEHIDVVTDHGVLEVGLDGSVLREARFEAPVSAVPRPGSHRSSTHVGMVLGLQNGVVHWTR